MREQQMEAAWHEGQRLLRLPGNAWAGEAITLYLDSKDHLRGLHPGDMSAWGRACFSAIRAGSGGLLGNPPVL